VCTEVDVLEAFVDDFHLMVSWGDGRELLHGERRIGEPGEHTASSMGMWHDKEDLHYTPFCYVADVYSCPPYLFIFVWSRNHGRSRVNSWSFVIE